jgi:cysteine synthase A
MNKNVILSLTISQADNTYFTDQFNNTDIITGYTRIGHELLEQVDSPIDAYCGGVGTAGILMGVSRAMRKANNHTQIIALE